MRAISIAILFAFSLAAADTPRVSPPFQILRPGGSPLTINQYRGKIVLLAFIDTNCSHCQELTGVISKIYTEYASKGVQVLECAFNDGASKTVPTFVHDFNPTFPVGYAERPAVLTYLQYSIMDTRPLYVPHLVIIDRGGTIRVDVPGESPFMGNTSGNIRAELDKLLKASPAPASKSKKK